jgi:hypothetical protein
MERLLARQVLEPMETAVQVLDCRKIKVVRRAQGRVDEGLLLDSS